MAVHPGPLPPRERETLCRRPVTLETLGGRDANVWPPLPAGEGRGEGERPVILPALNRNWYEPPRVGCHAVHGEGGMVRSAQGFGMKRGSVFRRAGCPKKFRVRANSNPGFSRCRWSGQSVGHPDAVETHGGKGIGLEELSHASVADHGGRDDGPGSTGDGR